MPKQTGASGVAESSGSVSSLLDYASKDRQGANGQQCEQDRGRFGDGGRTPWGIEANQKWLDEPVWTCSYTSKELAISRDTPKPT
ncbi:hypothetical protein NG895_07025 [Aeoliella sp. ICT_H6.2]|uniref:Uncharacterized protein n=1 Tax=Aeoliella straminimaris TaxID=2954799 RepID=A0A9X2F7C6_9BACT|nr:hypothetical protein [Aeoliella straminimaris]MCO6043655.1 hypothetical protein [Aeoliella straminimaris]